MSDRMNADKLESFINDYLKEDLKDLEKHINIRNNEIMEIIQLKNTLETMKENFTNDDGGFKTQINIGGNVFMEARVPLVDTVLVNVGKDIYVDFTLDEALIFANFKIKLLNKEIDVIREESIKKRVDIKLALMCIGEKTKLHQEHEGVV